MRVVNALIHNFETGCTPVFDEDGEQLLGFFYQFIDEQDLPVTQLIGPYRDKRAVERAAQRAFNRKDY